MCGAKGSSLFFRSIESGRGLHIQPNGIRLMELLDFSLEEVHLLPDRGRWNAGDDRRVEWQEAYRKGKTEWFNVLNTRIKKIYQGHYEVQIDLIGVKVSRIFDFSAMLAGYCPIEDYYKWVRDDSCIPVYKMTFDWGTNFSRNLLLIPVERKSFWGT